MKIVIAPYSTRLFTGNPNPKNFPHWHQVVHQLNALGHEVIQLGIPGEQRIIGASQFIINWPLKKLRDVILNADTWLSVDSFLPHFVWVEKLNKRGVVVWSLSDPLIWGHPENINLLKSREYVRSLQYQDWLTPTYNADAFVAPEEVVNAVQYILTRNRPADRAGVVSSSLQLAEQTQEESFTF